MWWVPYYVVLILLTGVLKLFLPWFALNNISLFWGPQNCPILILFWCSIFEWSRWRIIRNFTILLFLLLCVCMAIFFVSGTCRMKLLLLQLWNVLRLVGGHRRMLRIYHNFTRRSWNVLWVPHLFILLFRFVFDLIFCRHGYVLL